MTKELMAAIGIALALFSAIFAGGMRIGTLTERVDTQTKQIDRLTLEIQAVNAGIIAWTMRHAEPAPVRTR